MNKKGFTLIELLVVVLIIGIMASIAVQKYTKIITKIDAQEAVVNLDALSKAVHMHYTENGTYGGLDFNHLYVKTPESKKFTYTFSFGAYVSHLTAFRNDEEGNRINANHPKYYEIQYKLEDGVLTERACADSFRAGYQGETCKAIFSIKNPAACNGEVINCIIE